VSLPPVSRVGLWEVLAGALLALLVTIVSIAWVQQQAVARDLREQIERHRDSTQQALETLRGRVLALEQHERAPVR
jgi:hypothetical protein